MFTQNRQEYSIKKSMEKAFIICYVNPNISL